MAQRPNINPQNTDLEWAQFELELQDRASSEEGVNKFLGVAGVGLGLWIIIASLGPVISGNSDRFMIGTLVLSVCCFGLMVWMFSRQKQIAAFVVTLFVHQFAALGAVLLFNLCAMFLEMPDAMLVINVKFFVLMIWMFSIGSVLFTEKPGIGAWVLRKVLRNPAHHTFSEQSSRTRESDKAQEHSPIVKRGVSLDEEFEAAFGRKPDALDRSPYNRFTRANYASDVANGPIINVPPKKSQRKSDSDIDDVSADFGSKPLPGKKRA